MKILLVDDARSVVQVMTSRLSRYGYEVFAAENGAIAVEMFASLCPDLVLMDIEMPILNGFAATKEIRALEAQQQWAWTPIIFLTSSDTVDNMTIAIDAGGDDFMSKFAPEPVLQAKMKAMSRIAKLRHSLAQANAKLQSIADHDGLTGLHNRRSMDRQVDVAWSHAVSKGSSFGLYMIDIDNFKKYNDQYGHLAGDDCLKTVARSIEAAVQSSNATGVMAHAFVARYGGEEFAVILPSIAIGAISELANNIVDQVNVLAIEHASNANFGVVTISLGVSWQKAASGELKHVFRQADAKLYEAKTNGRNRVESWYL